ncbi:MAG: hypothetical protein Fur0018_04850 [Anaerolineales bacterium]
MLSSADFVTLPYTPDLTEGGIHYATRSLIYTYDRMGGTPSRRMRRIVAGIAVELAFRRYLNGQGVTFDVLGSTPFTDPDRYDVSLGGRKVDVKSFLVPARRQIRALRAHPEHLLDAEALVPCDQMDNDHAGPHDLFLFAFLLGLTATFPEALQRALAAGQPAYLLHTLPAAWASPLPWHSLGGLILKSETPLALDITLGGQDAGREFRLTAMQLPPGQRMRCPQEYYNLVFVHTRTLPTLRLGIHSPHLNDTHIIQPLLSPDGWDNIWVYGMSIVLAGYITREEFRRKAHRLPKGSQTFLYDQTRTENFVVPVSALHPVRHLLETALRWQQEHEH